MAELRTRNLMTASVIRLWFRLTADEMGMSTQALRQ